MDNMHTSEDTTEVIVESLVYNKAVNEEEMEADGNE